MLHSITIGDKHIYRDLRLVPTTRPVINPPKPVMSYLEIPGRNGKLDITEAIGGEINYENRTGSLEFYVMGGQNWSEVYSEIMNFLHGKRLSLVLDDDPDYTYFGRVSVNAWKSDKDHSYIVLDYDLEPFKYEKEREDALSVSGTQTYVIKAGGVYPVVPEFHVTDVGASFTVSANNKVYTLKKGTHRFPEIRAYHEDVTLLFGGTEISGTTVYVPSNTFFVYWRTDGSQHDYYGFKITGISKASSSQETLEMESTLPTDAGAAIALSGTNYPESEHSPYSDNARALWSYTSEETLSTSVSYAWERVKDSDITAAKQTADTAISRITVAEGSISTMVKKG